MKRGEAFAAAFLAVGFGFVSLVLIVIEPRMGFVTLADYFDPAKVLPAAASIWWMVGDVVYLGFGVALIYLGLAEQEKYQRVAGTAAGFGFLIVGSLGRVLAGLPTLVSDPGNVGSAALGLLAVRLAILRVAVLAVGVFAWWSTRSWDGPPAPRAWRGLGYVVLLAAIVFLFVFLPIPLLLMVWAGWFALRRARDA